MKEKGFVQPLKQGITFATSVYEKDWRNVLETDRYSMMLEACGYNFAHRMIVINNLEPESELLEKVDEMRQSNRVDQVHFSHMWRNLMLQHFEINLENLMPGYNYLIQNLTAIYFCPTEYLLWFTGDCRMENEVNWIDDAIKLMEEHERIVVANPTWNSEFDNAKASSSGEVGDFYYGYGFSDQCCLIPVARYREAIYDFDHKRSKRFPEYAGYSFERRVDSWMQNNSLLRITHKNASYEHKNFT
jgi:hypothetical protein